MSITSDIRGYAESVVEQGRHVLDQAQSQFGGATGAVLTPAGEFAADLRAQAEKAINLNAIRAAVEPYLAQADGYRHSVTDRAEELLDTAKRDPRVAKALGTAESVTGLVLLTVQDRLVKPARAFAGFDQQPAARKPAAAKAGSGTAKPARKPAARTASGSTPKTAAERASKPATTRSANAKASPRKASTARKSTSRKTGAQPSNTARSTTS